GHRVGHRPSELSGGEQQRTTIARALAAHPRIVWAEEHTGALDSETSGEIVELLRSLNDDGLTLVMVTHDDAIGAAAPRLVRMRDGRVVSDATQDAARDSTLATAASHVTAGP